MLSTKTVRNQLKVKRERSTEYCSRWEATRGSFSCIRSFNTRCQRKIGFNNQVWVSLIHYHKMSYLMSPFLVRKQWDLLLTAKVQILCIAKHIEMSIAYWYMYSLLRWNVYSLRQKPDLPGQPAWFYCSTRQAWWNQWWPPGTKTPPPHSKTAE